MAGQYEGVVEIVECRGAAETNDYLEAGYELLRIENVASSGRHPEKPAGNSAGSWFVRHTLRYVVGRTAAVAHREATPTPPRQQPEGETA